MTELRPPERTAPDRLVMEGLVIRSRDRLLVDQVGFTLLAGQVLALVGASGSGKTLTARACLGLVRVRPGVTEAQLSVTSGGSLFQPYVERRPKLRESAFRALRGAVVGYLPQEARASLDPIWTVARQVREVVALRARDAQASRGDRDTATDSDQGDDREASAHHWLRLAGFDDPAAVGPLYPHELSGGMAQRACIALALARGSRFLVADEPTTGLDPTVQQGILRQILALRDQGIGVLFITHDLRLVPRIADRVIVMHDGRIVDRLDAKALNGSQSVHTRRLLEATARVAGGTL